MQARLQSNNPHFMSLLLHIGGEIPATEILGIKKYCK